MGSELTSVTCPDCGGTIGELRPGELPCRCDEVEPPRSSDDTFVEEEQLHLDNSSAKPKVCVICGVDVAGKRRFKDSRGYTCYACGRAEQQAEIAGTAPCAECGRRIKGAGVHEYNGLKLCKRCLDDHREKYKQKLKQIGKIHVYQRHEGRNLLTLVIVATILLAIFLWRMLRH